MKLNLLPTYVSKEKQGRFAFVGAFLLAALGCAAMILMIRTSRQAVQDQQDRINQYRRPAETAVAISKQADDVMTQARGLLLNMGLAEKMNSHSGVYGDLYDEVRKYIPSFYRISAMNAVPNGPDSCTVTMTGYLYTFQQYADLMIALLRIPGATAVSRSGFQLTDPVIPNLIPQDQKGRQIKPGEPRIPDDPIDRLDQQIALARATGFQNAGGFGTTATPMVRQSMPNQNTITVAVVIAGHNLQTPDPRGTLAQSASLWGNVGAPAAGTTPATTPATTAPGTTPPVTNNTKTPPATTPPAKTAPGKVNRKNPVDQVGDDNQ